MDRLSVDSSLVATYLFTLLAVDIIIFDVS